jgi:lipoprotein Spr
MWIQKLKKTLNLFGLIIFLASCSSIKKSSAPINKETISDIKKSARTMEFLDNISVTPGEINNNNTLFNNSTKKINKSRENTSENLTDSEKANWLKRKYSIKMNISLDDFDNIRLLNKIDEWWGTPYLYGGSTKNGVDCSYFTFDVIKGVYNVNLKRTAGEQFEQCKKVEFEHLKDGDLIFFKTEGPNLISHVGIYIANNKFAHAGTSQGVTVGDLTNPYWQTRLFGFGSVNPKK